MENSSISRPTDQLRWGGHGPTEIIKLILPSRSGKRFYLYCNAIRKIANPLVFQFNKNFFRISSLNRNETVFNELKIPRTGMLEYLITSSEEGDIVLGVNPIAFVKSIGEIKSSEQVEISVLSGVKNMFVRVKIRALESLHNTKIMKKSPTKISEIIALRDTVNSSFNELSYKYPQILDYEEFIRILRAIFPFRKNGKIKLDFTKNSLSFLIHTNEGIHRINNNDNNEDIINSSIFNARQFLYIGLIRPVISIKSLIHIGIEGNWLTASIRLPELGDINLYIKA